MLRQIIGRFIKPGNITAIPYGTSYTVHLRLVRPVFDVVTTPNAVAEPAMITVTLDVNGYFPNDLFVMPGLYEVLTPYSPPRRVVIPAGSEPFDLVHALALHSVAVAPSVLSQLLDGYLTHDDLNAHIATIGGVSLGHVKNGGNVVIEPDGTLTAPDPDLSGYATTNAMQAADQGLQTQITANTSALTSKADLVGGKVPTSQLPAITIGETFTVNSQAAMLALTAQIGDIAMRSDLSNRKFLLTGTATTLADWIEIGATDAVSSVNGQTGVVMLSAADVGAATASHTHSHTVLTDIGTNTHAQIDSHIANLNNPHAVTAAQIGALTQSQGDARYQLATSVPSYPTTNLVHDFRLIGNLLNSANAFTPAQFHSKTLSNNPFQSYGVRQNTPDANGIIALPDTFASAANQTIYLVVRVRATGSFPIILGSSTTAVDKGIELYLVSSAAQWRPILADASGFVDAQSAAFSLNTWYCLALVFIAGTSLTLYQNGTQVAQISSTKIPVATAYSLGTALTSSGTIIAGGSGTSQIDLATVLQYNVAHDATQRTAVYNGLKADLTSRGVTLP